MSIYVHFQFIPSLGEIISKLSQQIVVFTMISSAVCLHCYFFNSPTDLFLFSGQFIIVFNRIIFTQVLVEHVFRRDNKCLLVRL